MVRKKYICFRKKYIFITCIFEGFEQFTIMIKNDIMIIISSWMHLILDYSVSFYHYIRDRRKEDSEVKVARFLVGIFHRCF